MLLRNRMPRQLHQLRQRMQLLQRMRLRPRLQRQLLQQHLQLQLLPLLRQKLLRMPPRSNSALVKKAGPLGLAFLS